MFSLMCVPWFSWYHLFTNVFQENLWDLYRTNCSYWNSTTHSWTCESNRFYLEVSEFRGHTNACSRGFWYGQLPRAAPEMEGVEKDQVIKCDFIKITPWTGFLLLSCMWKLKERYQPHVISYNFLNFHWLVVGRQRGLPFVLCMWESWLHVCPTFQTCIC